MEKVPSLLSARWNKAHTLRSAGSVLHLRAGCRAMRMHRRQLLTTAAWFFAGTALSRATEIAGQLPWSPNAGNPPTPVRPGPWQFFTLDEATAVEALADRIIPADPQTPGGKDAGCAVYVDRQLAGPYGSSEGHYNQPPFMKGGKNQGPQAAGGPAKIYRDGLAALERYCRTQHGKRFAELTDDTKDALLKELEAGKVKLENADGKEFFEHVIKDIQTGFFAGADLRPQPRHGRVEDDRPPRRPLQLFGLDR